MWHLNQNPQGHDSSGTALKPGLNFCETQVNGNYRLFLQKGGNVGIGTASPGSDADMTGGLTINGAGSTQLTVQNTGVSGFKLNVSPGQWIMYDKTGGNWNASLSSANGSIGMNGLNIDQANGNTGNTGNGVTGPGLTFGHSSGEGIASCRAGNGANQYGLDFLYQIRGTDEHHAKRPSGAGSVQSESWSQSHPWPRFWDAR
jgi:hypothetical protein